MKVACKGSGRQTNVGFNVKRAPCPVCGDVKDLTGNGRIRKHARMITGKQLRAMK